MPKKSLGVPKKIAFVCSGGASKAGAFHMGVCLALQEKGFSFLGGKKKPSKAKKPPLMIDTYVGSSAGSFISSYLAAGYTVDEIFEAYMSKEKGRLKPIGFSNLLSLKSSQHEEKTNAFAISKRLKDVSDYALNALYNRKLITMPGVFTTAGLERYIRGVLDSNSFSDYPADLFIVATQLNHSRRIIFGKRKLPIPLNDKTCAYETEVSISDAVAASTALPPIFSPYGIKHNNKLVYYIDGEIRETLSLHVAEDAGADLIIASHTHTPYHFNREIGSLTKYGITTIGIQAIYLMVERKINKSKFNRDQKLAALDAVSEYCRENLTEKDRKKITAILEEKLSVIPKNKHIYIHPKPSEHQMFFGEHFSLKRKHMEKIVQFGFRSAIDTLRKYDFNS